jgi:hypothetical protein
VPWRRIQARHTVLFNKQRRFHLLFYPLVYIQIAASSVIDGINRWRLPQKSEKDTTPNKKASDCVGDIDISM